MTKYALRASDGRYVFWVIDPHPTLAPVGWTRNSDYALTWDSMTGATLAALTHGVNATAEAVVR